MAPWRQLSVAPRWAGGGANGWRQLGFKPAGAKRAGQKNKCRVLQCQLTYAQTCACIAAQKSHLSAAATLDRVALRLCSDHWARQSQSVRTKQLFVRIPSHVIIASHYSDTHFHPPPPTRKPVALWCAVPLLSRRRWRMRCAWPLTFYSLRAATTCVTWRRTRRRWGEGEGQEPTHV